MRTIVDVTVREAMEQALEYWEREADDATLRQRLHAPFSVTLKLIKAEPERGRSVPQLPAHYRQIKLGKHLPPYTFFYRINVKDASVLVFLLRHQSQLSYAPATIRKKASEANRRARRQGE